MTRAISRLAYYIHICTLYIYLTGQGLAWPVSLARAGEDGCYLRETS